MLKTSLLLIFVIILIPLIDYIWLAKIMSNFYIAELGDLARKEDGKFQPMIAPAVAVYFCLAIGIVFFVLPKSESVTFAFGWGALLGFAIYGVYEMTNLSLIRDWPLKMSFVDMAWGTFLCGVCGAAAKWAEGILPG